MLGSRLRHERWSAKGFALLLLWAGAAGAVEGPVIPGAIDGGVPRVEASLVADVDRAAPGVPFTLGVRFQIPEGWHIYWKHPGETGLSTEVAFEVPGLQVGSLRWPFPETFRSPDGFITSYGYGGEVILFSEATLTPGAAADSVPLQDRKSTRLNSSHVKISYAVFCLKKKKKKTTTKNNNRTRTHYHTLNR